MSNYPPGADTADAPWNVIEIDCPHCDATIAHVGDDTLECPACGHVVRHATPDPDRLRDERDDA